MTPNDFEHFRQLGENVGIEFKRGGNADELGSGTRNLFRYVRLYSGAVPVLDEEDQFKVTIPLDESHNPESVPQTARETTRETARETTRETTKLSLDENAQGILDALESAPSTTIRELAKRLGITAKGVEWHLKRLKSAGLLVREGGRARRVESTRHIRRKGGPSVTVPRQLELFDLPPDPAALIPSLRDIGYSFESAVADLVDNSIAVGARRVEVRRVEEWLSSVECGRIFCAA